MTWRRLFPWLSGLLLAAAASLPAIALPAPAHAQPNGEVAVAYFDGPAASRIRSAVGRAFRGRVVSPSRWSRATRRLGRPGSPAEYAELAAEVEAVAIIDGLVDRRPRRWAVEIVVRNGADGEEIGRMVFEERSRGQLQRRLQRTVDRELADLLARARPAPVELPEAGGDARIVVVREFDGGRRAERFQGMVRELVDEDPGFTVVDDGVMSPADVDAYIAGGVDRVSRRVWAMNVRVTNGADGRTLADVAFEERNLPRLRRAVGRTFWDELRGPLAQSESRTRARPPEPEVVLDGAGADDDEGAYEDEDAPGDHGLPALEVSVSAQFLNRQLAYNDDLFGALRPYDLPFWPFVAGELQIYPFAFVSSGPFSHLGLVVRGDGAPGLSSQDSQGNTFPTTSWGLSVLMRGRVPVDRSEIGFVAGYGVRNFQIGTDGSDNEPEVPDTEYGFLEFGADSRINLVEELFLTLRGSYLLLTATGELGSSEWFPRNTGGGLEGEVGAAYHLLEGLELRGSFLYRRFWFSMNPEVGDPRVAGGAVDQYFGVTAGIAWRFVPDR